jgi:simple sugar transport system permease protein
MTDLKTGPTEALEFHPPNRMRSGLEMALLYVASLGGAILLSGLLVTLTGNSWKDVFGALLDGAFLAPGRWGTTLNVAAPMLLVAIGMVIGVKAGMFNIGQEGQLMIGAMAMVAVGTEMPGPGPHYIVLGLVLAFMAGGAYAGLAATMRYRRGVPEVISTLLLVFIALQIVGFAVTTDWLLRDVDPNLPTRAVNSEQLPESVRLPVIRIFDNEVHWGILIGVLTAVAIAYILGRTIWGFRFRLLGHNPNVAQKVGVAATRTGTMALFLSGAFAGLAGAVMLMGGFSNYRLTTGFSTNIGWQGLLVALVARSRPLLCIPMAILFAALRTGSGFLAATGVDRKIVDVVQALLVLALLIPPAIQFVRERRQALAAASEDRA